MIVRIFVEGTSDVPTVREIFVRGLGQVQGSNFQIYAHRGKGKLPKYLKAKPNALDMTLLGQLPAKLRAYGRSRPNDPILVLVDLDRDNLEIALAKLKKALKVIKPKPKRILFRFAIEEVESWFIADHGAVKKAYPHVDISVIRPITPDSIVGAWEKLAESLKLAPSLCTGVDKEEWAQQISPHLNLELPTSPSMKKFIEGAKFLAGT
jgi:hypothetical protein